MAQPNELARIILNYQDVDRALRDNTLGFVERAWLSLDNYRDADINSFAKRVVPVVEGAQLRAGAMAEGYLRALLALAGAQGPTVGVTAQQASTAALRGLSGLDLWQRPGQTVWWALSRGVSFLDAKQSGLSRALNLASTNLQLSKTQTSQRVLSSNGQVTGYKRVLSGKEDCAICSLAAKNTYHKAELMPIHGGCDCSVAPIINGMVSSQTIPNAKISKEENSRLEGTSKEIEVKEHGELGPVLTIKGQNFTGPDDLTN
jgi:hypothetical protein